MYSHSVTTNTLLRYVLNDLAILHNLDVSEGNIFATKEYIVWLRTTSMGFPPLEY